MSLAPRVSIIMGSTSDLPIMEKAAMRLDALGIPFEMLALSAHRTPREVEAFATSAKERGIRVIIGAAGCTPLWRHCLHDLCPRHRGTDQGFA